jgi:Fe-S cluster assembly iron-binding protein IscA
VGSVLTISAEASQAIRGILDASDVPAGSMFRISPQDTNGASPGALMVTLIEAPPPEDQIVEGEDEVSVAVEPTAAELLDDKQLDATVVGEEVNFSIGDQVEQTE